MQKNRQSLLADIAEMYFLDGKTQAEIAKKVGVTRSNISRMLTEARKTGIIEIQINRPLKENPSLAEKLIDRFRLISARVVVADESAQRLDKLGKVAARELTERLKPGWIIGTSWGTAISATVNEIETPRHLSGTKVVQLLGALGARVEEYDAHAIVRRLAKKLDAEAVYMNAPFLVEDQQTARSLLSNKSISKTILLGEQADIALLGVGSSDLETSSYYLADYVDAQEIFEIQNSGAIGDVCGRFYDISGQMTAFQYQNRLVGISKNGLLGIPIRIGVAGGPAKVDPIIGALTGQLINVLISDERTILDVLSRTN